MSVVERARDSYDTLCCLYGDSNAQGLMKVRGACNTHVARLALAMIKSPKAVDAARVYGRLFGLRWGFGKLMAASGEDGSVRRVVIGASRGRKFTAWEVDRAVEVVLKLIDISNGRN
ncbi:MAG: hypothetical protein IJG84_11005 [Kiritimatiellae bacterium]|nr:hypothetical protein [Kiritimatiellia bacterium]